MPKTQSHTPTNWLRTARIARRLKQAELAELAGISRVALSHLENDKTRPRFSTERRLAAVLDFDVEELFPPRGKVSPSAELRDWSRALNGRTRR